MVAQVVAEGADLVLLPPEPLVIELPHLCQLGGALQFLVVCQHPNGLEQNQAGDQDEGEHHQPLVHGEGMHRRGRILLIGQQYHRHQGAQGHGGQSQDQFPQTGRQHHRALRQTSAKEQEEQPKNHRSGQAGDDIIAVQQGQIGI